MPENSEPSKGTREFTRELGLFDSVMIVVGSMIGSGIFIVSADISRTIGSPFLLLLVWLITGLVTITAALSYGELAGMLPHAGGQYVYLREAYNPLMGFLYGWTFFMVIQTGTIAAVGVAFAKFTGVLVPWFSDKNYLFTLFGLKFSTQQLLAIASIFFLSFSNSRGLKEGKAAQNVFTSTKTLALFALILLGLIIGANKAAISANFSHFWGGEWLKVTDGKITSSESLTGIMVFAAIGVAMVGSLFSSDAWNNITFTAGEVKNPRRTIPLSLFLGTLIVTILYLSANIAYLCSLPLRGTPEGTNVMTQGIQFAVSDRVGTAASSLIFGDTSVIIMAVLIMISTFGCNNGLILAGARVYYAMAKDNLFFKKAGTLNKNMVPSFGIYIQAFWAAILCLSGSYSDLLDYVVFAVLIFYILTIIGIFILRKKMPDAERPYKAWGYPVVPAFYIVIAFLICIDLLIFKTDNTYPGVIFVLAGIPVYYLWRRLAKNNN
jgi:basic amino acid/polyamine antiporter, APA family